MTPVFVNGNKEEIWLRSIDDDICPLSGIKLRIHGDRFNPYPNPCVLLDEDRRVVGKCEYLIVDYCGMLNATVLCGYVKE